MSNKVLVTNQRSKWVAQQRRLLQSKGFDVDVMTSDQIELVLQPVEKPEVYFEEGGLNPEQALISWIERMAHAEMSHEHISKAKELVM